MYLIDECCYILGDDIRVTAVEEEEGRFIISDVIKKTKQEQVTFIINGRGPIWERIPSVRIDLVSLLPLVSDINVACAYVIIPPFHIG